MTLTLDLTPALAGRACPDGDAAALRVQASRLDAAAQRYEQAVQQLRTRTGGLPGAWRGTASGAARADLDDLQARALDAAGVHLEAAHVLRQCAVRLEDAQATWDTASALSRQDHAERAARIAAAARGAFPVPYDVDDSALRRQARHLADQAHAEADEALSDAAARLRDLAAQAPAGDAPTLHLREQVSGFGRGAVDAIRGSVVTVAGLSLPRMLVDREGWLEQVRGIRDGAAYAAAHPGEAGRAAVGWELLEDGRYGEWAGGLVPDLLGTVVSGGALPIARRGADVAGDLGDLAEDVDDLQRVHARAVDVNAGGPVRPRPGSDLPPGYATHIQDLTPQRRRHILYGDEKGGGHRSGVGNRRKTEFPAHWSDDDIIDHVMKTARSPESGFWSTKHQNFNVTADYEGVTVLVSVDQAGNVVTAYPLPGGRGVVRNP